MKIIGLTGPAGSGKSTVAGILRVRHAYHEVSFAHPLRDFVKRLLGIDSDTLQQIKEKPQDALCGWSPREVMQMMGQEFGREMIGIDLWVRRVDREIGWLTDLRETGVVKKLNGIVVSDVRYPNEAEYIRERGELWRLTRAGHAVPLHASEAGVTVTDREQILDNDCDLPTLNQRVAQLLGAAR